MQSLRSLLLASLLVAATIPVASVPAHAAAVGAFAGLNRGSIKGDAPNNVEYRKLNGPIFGAQGEIEIGSDVLLSLQPMVVHRGSKIADADSTDGVNDGVELDVALDYFAIPIVVKFMTGKGRTYVTGGVDVAFLSAATIEGDGVDVDVKDSFESTDISALLGFGVVFPVGRPQLTVEARWVHGMVNLAGDPGGPITNLPDRFRSSGLQFTAGILFPLGRP